MFIKDERPPGVAAFAASAPVTIGPIAFRPLLTKSGLRSATLAIWPMASLGNACAMESMREDMTNLQRVWREKARRGMRGDCALAGRESSGPGVFREPRAQGAATSCASTTRTACRTLPAERSGIAQRTFNAKLCEWLLNSGAYMDWMEATPVWYSPLCWIRVAYSKTYTPLGR